MYVSIPSLLLNLPTLLLLQKLEPRPRLPRAESGGRPRGLLEVAAVLAAADCSTKVLLLSLESDDRFRFVGVSLVVSSLLLLLLLLLLLVLLVVSSAVNMMVGVLSRGAESAGVVSSVTAEIMAGES